MIMPHRCRVRRAAAASAGGGGGGGGGAIVNAVNFDGTNDYLTRGASLTGAVDGKEVTVSYWMKVAADGPTLTVLNNPTASASVLASRNGNNKAIVQFNTSAGGIAWYIVPTQTTKIVDGWVHVLASGSTATSVSSMYIDDVLVVPSDSGMVADALIDFTKSEWFVGAAVTTASKFNGDLAELWFDDVFIDLSVVANRRKFITSTLKPVNLGSDGSTPTGTAPLIYLSGDTATWHTNKGTGGGFTENGALTTAATSPSD